MFRDNTLLSSLPVSNISSVKHSGGNRILRDSLTASGSGQPAIIKGPRNFKLYQSTSKTQDAITKQLKQKKKLRKK